MASGDAGELWDELFATDFGFLEREAAAAGVPESVGPGGKLYQDQTEDGIAAHLRIVVRSVLWQAQPSGSGLWRFRSESEAAGAGKVKGGPHLVVLGDYIGQSQLWQRFVPTFPR